MTNKLAIGDADGLIALVLENDPNHNKAIERMAKFEKNGVEIIFPVSVFPEAITALVRAANQPEKAQFINEQLIKGVFHVEYLGSDILMRACNLFKETKSKKNTMFDALVVATAEKFKTKTIFSFDKW